MIGIFGDSYTDPNCGSKNGKCSNESWINFLRDSAISHGIAGSAQLCSYRQFLQHHEKYDRIVFIMTNPDRMDNVGNENDWQGHFITSIDIADNILNDGFWNTFIGKVDQSVTWNKPRVRAMRDWILFNTMDQNQKKALNTYSSLIMEGILHVRPDTILIPMGYWGTFNWSGMPKGSKCFEYTLLQARSLFPDQPHFSNHDNNQLSSNMLEQNCSNHLTLEINQLFAEHVRRALSGEGWQDWGINNIPAISHSNSWDYYYKKK